MKRNGQQPASNTLETVYSSSTKLLSRSQLATLGEQQIDQFYKKKKKTLDIIHPEGKGQNNGNGHERQQG